MRTQLGMSLVTGLAVAAGLSQASCSAVDCGEGTVERDGTCVPADQNPDPAQCGPGPVLGACDPMTTVEQFDEETGITTCIGVGGGCDVELPCDAPDSGHTSLCGRLWDTETDTLIAPATGATGTACNPAMPAATGPCSLDLKFYDALDFATDPGAATPVSPRNGVYLDDCGRYRGINIPETTFGFLGIGIDDAAGLPDRYRLTGVATDENLARPGTGFRAYATRVTTDQTWTTSANLTGESFATRGVLAIVFHRDDEDNMPVTGVTLRRTGNNVPNDQDFYFDDAGIGRTSIADPTNMNDAVDVTGMNGTVLSTQPPTPTQHDGVGGLPAGCQWPTNLAAAIRGVVFVQIKHAEQTGGGGPCTL
jgi:hypothetical protein